MPKKKPQKKPSNRFFTVVLPWPYKELNPNQTVHWRTKAKYTKSARELAAYTLKEQHGTEPIILPNEPLIAVRVFYMPQDKRFVWDNDNLAAMMKAYQDGIFDCLVDPEGNKLDDQIVKTTINERMGHDENPRVIFSLTRAGHSAWLDRVPALVYNVQKN